LNILTPVGDIKGVIELFIALSNQKDPMVMIQYYLTFTINAIVMGRITQIIMDKLNDFF